MRQAFESVWASWGERGEATFDSGLTYGPDGPVLVQAGKRLDHDWIASLPERVARASVALYEALLDLE